MPDELVPAINDDGEVDPDGNTYVTVEEADTYFDNRVSASDWEDQDDEDKERALLTAIDLLDSSKRWIGAPVQETQPLAWPRVAIRPIERRSRRRVRTGFETLTGATGGLYDAKSRFWASTAIPTPVKNAQCELAFAILVNGFNVDGEAEVKQFSDDKMSVTFERPAKRGEMPLTVARLLAPFTMSGPETMRG